MQNFPFYLSDNSDNLLFLFCFVFLKSSDWFRYGRALTGVMIGGLYDHAHSILFPACQHSAEIEIFFFFLLLFFIGRRHLVCEVMNGPTRVLFLRVGSIGEQEQLGAVSCHISKRRGRNNARASVAGCRLRECRRRRRRNDELNKVWPKKEKERRKKEDLKLGGGHNSPGR